ncbi:MAG TPA: sugar ABC transporter permease [Halococcus sp.]|nr:sugar ABC transporter permease [Halococcus sp.]
MSTEGSRRSAPYRFLVDWQSNLSETQFAYLLLVPVFIVLGGVAFWPLLETFWTSFHADTLGAVGTGGFVGFENYVSLFTGETILPRPFLDLSQPWQSALIVTIVFTVISVAFETVIGLGQALVLDQDFRGRRWARVVIILPWAVPIVIQGMIFFLLFQPTLGFATPILHDWGLVSTTPLNDATSSLLIVIIADVWKTSAFMALLILAGLQSVDRSLYNVAKVSGATKWQQFKMITWPLILPTVLIALLFRTMAALRIYGLIETVSGCSTLPSLSCLVVSTYFEGNRLGSSAAIAFVTAVIIAAFVSVYIYRYAQEGL